MITNPKLAFDGQVFEYDPAPIGCGGQGTVYKASSIETPSRVAVVKALPKQEDTRKRLRFWSDGNHSYHIPGLSAPLAQSEDSSGRLYYLATYSTGVSLEDDRSRTFPELLETAILMVGIWVRLERAGIAHGDIAPSNFLITPEGDVSVIDVDNFYESSMPSPSMYGQHGFMAPEIRQERNLQCATAKTNLESDRFAWAVLLSFWLFGRHPADRETSISPAEFDALMSSGQWPEVSGNRRPDEFPISAIGLELRSLFERGFLQQPDQRPNAEDWYHGLWSALTRLHVHDCGGAFVLERSRQVCPWCNEKLAKQSEVTQVILTHLTTKRRHVIKLKRGDAVSLGREMMPGLSTFVSATQLELVAKSDTLTLTHQGRNPTCIRLASGVNQEIKNTLQVKIDQPPNKPFFLSMADEVFAVRFSN